MEKINKQKINENLSEIEKIRLRNIEERRKIFEGLNLDSLKKKARSHIEYQKAQIIAKRRQCQECGEKFPNESLKRNHIISVHQERRSSYPRAKKIVKKPSTPKKSPKPPRSPITAWREFPFISKCSDYFPTYKKYNVAIYKKKSKRTVIYVTLN